jgi:hypothetical protein
MHAKMGKVLASPQQRSTFTFPGDGGSPLGRRAALARSLYCSLCWPCAFLPMWLIPPALSAAHALNLVHTHNQSLPQRKLVFFYFLFLDKILFPCSSLYLAN